MFFQSEQTSANGEEKTTVCLHDDEAYVTKLSEDI